MGSKCNFTSTAAIKKDTCFSHGFKKITMHNTYFHIMHSTLQYGCSFDSNWQIYDSFNRKHKRLLDTYQEIRPDNFSFDTLCKKHIMLPLNCIRIHSLIITVFQQMFYMIITANICILK